MKSNRSATAWVSAKPRKLSVRIQRPNSLKRLTPDDFRSYYTNRYNSLRDILLKKMDIVSINKLGGSQTGASVIGMVRERVAGGFMLEDTTGEVEVLSKDRVDEDDVLGVVGDVREGRLVQTQMIWPDVPLTKEPNTIAGMTILLADSADSEISATAKPTHEAICTCSPMAAKVYPGRAMVCSPQIRPPIRPMSVS